VSRLGLGRISLDLARITGALTFFLALAVFKTWPLATVIASHIPGSPGDPLLNTWILGWVIHALGTAPTRLFQANIFYPVENALAFSEHLLGVQPLFAPVYLATGNPLAGYNVAFLLSFALSALAAFALVHRFTRAFWPSLAAGTLFGFAPYRFGQLNHIQLLSSFWAPLALLSLDLFLRSRRWVHLAAFAVLYWLQVLSCVYVGYMLTVAVALYASYRALVVDRSLWSASVLVKGLTFAAASAVVLVPLHLPYFDVSRTWDFTRSVAELKLLSPDLLSYLSPPPLINDAYVRMFWSREIPAVVEKRLFPGLVLPALAVIGSFGCVRALSPDATRHIRRAFWLIAAAAWLISLGPYLIVAGRETGLPLPYLLLYDVVPGFASMRLPGRFALLAVLAATPLAALGVLRCGEQCRRAVQSSRWSPFITPFVALLAIALALVELGGKPMPVVAIPAGADVPPVYGWLARERPGPVVELPFGADLNPAWRREYAGELNDLRYVYLSTAHWLPIANGVSGFNPPTYDEIHAALRALPDSRAIEYASALGLKAVVVHTGKLRPDEAVRWLGAELPPGLTRVKAFGADVVYAVASPAARAPGAAAAIAADQAAPGQRLRAGLEIRAGVEGPWIHRRPPGVSTVLAQWTDRDGHSREAASRARLPLVVRRGEAAVVPFDLGVPDSSGDYALRVSVPADGLRAEPQLVHVRRGVPTSRNAPHRLAAAYAHALDARGLDVTSARPFALELTASNTGEAVWLADPPGGVGSVALQWRWSDGLGPADGVAALPCDTAPGQQSRFRLSVEPPTRPGRYALELGMVSERVASFADVGSRPVRLEIAVQPLPRSTLDAQFERLRVPVMNPPDVVSAPQSTADGVRLDLAWRSGQRRIVDVYLALEAVDGTLWFSDGKRWVPFTGGWWIPIATGLALPEGTHAGPPLKIPLGARPIGSYAYRVVVTEPDSNQIIAEAEGHVATADRGTR
jgi:hypothetical protein